MHVSIRDSVGIRCAIVVFSIHFRNKSPLLYSLEPSGSSGLSFTSSSSDVVNDDLVAT